MQIPHQLAAGSIIINIVHYMIILLSPAKNLNFTRAITINSFSIARFRKESEILIKALNSLEKAELTEMMHINNKLAELNFIRHKQWTFPDSMTDSRQAILAFNGEVYNGLKAWELNEDDLKFSQEHIRILSGLHGILQPLDLIKPYRLEMGAKLPVPKITDLYRFWGNKIFQVIDRDMENQTSQVIINLASAEYSKAANIKKFSRRIITPVFKQLKGEEYKVIIVYTKKARGLMTRFIIDNRIEDPDQLKLFEAEGYFYDENLSTENEWTFVR